MADGKKAPTEISAKEAVSLFERAHTDKPNDANAHLNLGSAYYVSGDWDKAIEEFQHALAQDSNLDHAHYYLGVLYGKKGDAVRARAEFDKVLNGGAHALLKSQARIQMAQLGKK
ncbi:MAG: tetratricopeptide repeat protein [Chloroflexi bacterium]|nr:tetratricopeptide repeat protein [Chloroflexota bacterium]MBI3740196.1 tetratricopeptide repeat protein [Chloroflexota bacterium]